MKTAINPKIDKSRLKYLKSVKLEQGAHSPPSNGVEHACAMEMASYIVDEPWSASPQCVCPIISAFLRSWNDGLNDEDRNRLLPGLIPLTIDTRSAKKVELRRAWMVVDWLIREFVPAWLRFADLDESAEALASAAEINDLKSAIRVLLVAKEGASAARLAVRSATWSGSAAWSAVRSATWSGSAAWSAAESAAWSAAESAAWSAARSAAWSATWSGSAAWSAAWSATWSAAESAAWSATWSAAESATRSAAVKKLRPTVLILQDSAKELVVRLCEVKE